MQPSEPYLYPNLSSIYNKIMQLALAIVFIVVLMNFWIYSAQQSEQTIQAHFSRLGHEYSVQTVAGLKIFMTTDNKTGLQQYIDTLAKSDWIEDIHLYGATGELLASSNSPNSINELYGISPQKVNRSNEFVPFIQEIRAKKVIGYLRLTIKKDYFIDHLSQNNQQQSSLLRLMMLLAGVVGFLLTRGLNRFSRHGFRLNTPAKAL